jgi:hypothetical protein
LSAPALVSYARLARHPIAAAPTAKGAQSAFSDPDGTAWAIVVNAANFGASSRKNSRELVNVKPFLVRI